MSNYESNDVRDILNCTGIVLPEQKPLAPPKPQKRPKKEPKLRWHAGRSQGQTTTSIFFSLVKSTDLYVAKTGEIVARIAINPDAVADIPLYDIPNAKY